MLSHKQRVHYLKRAQQYFEEFANSELPQLLNVLRGEMSIVGPRPHALASRAGEQLFWKIDARYWDRHAIKPGMTGLAQVRGLRGPTPETSDLMQRLISDNEYIANWSLLSDVFIMLRTMRVLVHRNARDGRLKFTTSLPEAIAEAELAFIAVGTPQGANGGADLSGIWAVGQEIGRRGWQLVYGGGRAGLMGVVADEAGISVGSLYQYFPNRRALLAAVFAAQPLAHWAALFDGVPACVTPVLRLDES